MWVGMGACTCHRHIWMSENNSWELALALHLVEAESLLLLMLYYSSLASLLVILLSLPPRRPLKGCDMCLAAGFLHRFVEFELRP